MGDITITIGTQCDVPDEELTIMDIELAQRPFVLASRNHIRPRIQDSIDKMIRQQVEWHAAQRAVTFPRLNPIIHPALPMYNLASMLSGVRHLEALLNQKIDEALNE